MTKKDEEFEFTAALVQERLVDHALIAQHFLDAIENDLKSRKADENVTFEIDLRRLYLAIGSAYQDIARYKVYHQANAENKKLDSNKRSAFLVKWIVKFKPIMPRLKDGDGVGYEDTTLDAYQAINEEYAITVAEIHLSEEKDFDFAFTEFEKSSMAYDLLYRDISTDALITYFSTISHCVPHAETLPFLEAI